MTPEIYLRLMADDLADAQDPELLRVRANSVQAVAQAFTMLGLLSAESAEGAMTQARQALALPGAAGLEPEVSPAAGGDYWGMRAEGQRALAWKPRSVAAGTLRLSVAAADLRCDWFRTAQAGLRFQVQAAAMGQQLPALHAQTALTQLAAADDAGRSYRLRWDRGRGSARLWMGEVIAEPVSEQYQPADVAWLALLDADGPAGRVVFAPPAAIPAGTASPAWPTPAECYLAWFSRQDPAAESGSNDGRDGRDVVAAVAESLVRVGAIPAQSPLLPSVLGRQKRSSHPALPAAWPHAVRVGTPPDLQVALCVAVPFEHAAVVIEGISAWGEDIQLHMYGWPWIGGHERPAAIPCFTVRATDDLGHEHEGRAGSWHDYGSGEGHGDFTLWPGVQRRACQLHVVVSTLWEAGWADIALPGW